MQDCEHYDALGFDTVEDSIREACNECATYFAMYTRKHLRIALQGVKGRIDRGKECSPSPGA